MLEDTFERLKIRQGGKLGIMDRAKKTFRVVVIENKT
jgi:hypothetical protein